MLFAHQEQLKAELLANPIPAPPAPESVEDLQGSAIPPHVLDGSHITISDLMVGGDLSKDQHLSVWLDAREKMGFAKMADSVATGLPEVDEAAVRTLATLYQQDHDNSKCRGNAITRSCAFTGSFVILESGRRVLYPKCPGATAMCAYVLLISVYCSCMSCVVCCVYSHLVCLNVFQDGLKP